MAKLIIHNQNIPDAKAFIALCPFQALEITEGMVSVNAACRMCKICVKDGPAGAAEYIEDVSAALDKDAWRGVAVYAEQSGGQLHPVTLELLGKARELANKIKHPVFVLCIGSNIGAICSELLHYGADTVYAYDHPALRDFHIETYTSLFHDFVMQYKPSAVLVGGTPAGRQLAPRVAARLRTGLTADCTALDIRQNTDLVQIRPAFGGNIMAEIITPDHRPQMATVRYKVMEAPERNAEPAGEILQCAVLAEHLFSHMDVIDRIPREPEKTIETAEILVVAGRGVKRREDIALLQELADALGGQLACTRPLSESGWIDAKRQIGLSGRSVRPKLILTCGVSGAIQFIAGMGASELIIAINTDEKAPIMRTAHIAIVGDLYEIVPQLLQKLKNTPGGNHHEL